MVSTTRDQWGSRTGFIFATIGSAVGIGSIWKFPYEVGANGGGAFVVVYILGLILVVVPLMLAEFAIGRRGQADAAGSIANIARAERTSTYWQAAGLLGALTCFLILSFYSVIGGWTLGYTVETLLRGLPQPNAAAVQAQYDAWLAAPGSMLAYHAVFMAVCAAVVMRGVQRGIESTAKILMPLLIALMIALALYSMIEGDALRALRFLFLPDLQHLNARAVLDALGLGFFSIGVGLGLMITYAAYSGAAIDLKQVAIVSVAADSAISLVAGLAVFPIVFANGLDPASGPGLVFVSLPLAFANMPFGAAAASAFFLLLFVAALSSAISMLEGVVAVLVHRCGWSRPRAALLAASACFVVGIATVLSFNRWADWFPLATVDGFANATWYDLIDYFTSNLLLPSGGLAIALFVGWASSEVLLRQELKLGANAARGLHLMLRYVAPAVILATTLAALLR